VGGSEKEQRLRDLPPKGGLVSAEALKYAIVKIG
jgi:hypothetical protein